MPDYRSMYDGVFLGAWNLVNDKDEHVDVTVTIAKVEGKEIGAPKKNKAGQIKQDRCPVLYFLGKELGFVVNKTNGKTLAGMYGIKTEGWVGKRITLYATTTKMGGDIVDCIRVRVSIPKEGGK
jgi:hypothetical protein